MIKNNNKNQMIIGTIVNFVIFGVTVFAILWQILFRGNSGPLGEFGSGLGSLQTFTNDSNILMAIIALALAIAGIVHLVQKEYNYSHFWRILQLTGTTAVLLTFTTVAVFLAPLYTTQTGDPLILFGSSMFFTHLLTPILAVLNFVFFTPSQEKIKKQEGFVALMPVLIYGFFYIKNVVIIKNWPDFYNFTFGGYPQLSAVTAIVMFLVTFALAQLLIYLNNDYHNLRS